MIMLDVMTGASSFNDTQIYGTHPYLTAVDIRVRLKYLKLR